MTYAQARDYSEIDSFIVGTMMTSGIPGLAIAVVRDDSVIFAKGYGVRMAGKPGVMNEHTLFQASSITKSFTAALMGILVDRGKVSLTDPVKKYIPEFETSEPFVTERLTILDILCLRSGILGGDTLRAESTKDLIHQLKNLKISQSFRLGLSSYNLHYLLAGCMEEIIASKKWEEILNEEIFIPLEMKESFTDNGTAMSRTKNISTPHYVENEKLVPGKWEDFGIYGPADCIVSNVLDLAKWATMQIQEGSYNGKTIISPVILSQMQAPQFLVPDWLKGIYNPSATFMTLGLGWFVHDYAGFKVVEIGGAALGVSNTIAMIPSEKIGIVIHANKDGAFDALAAIKFKIFDHFFCE